MPQQSPASADPAEQLAHYPLLRALIERRSSRFARGLELNGGPLAYRSAARPQPLTVDEEAALAFAACGISGYALADLPYRRGEVPEAGGGNIMVQCIGRTVASGDALHDVTVFVINDEGAWLLRRPQDYPRGEIAGLIQAAHDHRFSDLYAKSRVRIAQRRLEVPRELPFVLAFNKWSANVPGTTYFLPIAECSALYINILLSAFDDDFCYFIVDERNRFQPAGIAEFARSRGGHLHDAAAGGRVATVGFIESWIYELVAIPQGAMLQNMGLMAQALGLGGFPHSAAHPFIWFQTLGFRMVEPRFSHTVGAGPVLKALLRTLKKDIRIPTAVGLERDGQVLIKPYCPPYYRSMEQAVLAFVDRKFAPGTGTLRDGGAVTGWRDGAAVQAGIPRYSDRAIAATIAYCTYIYRRYGRFPANSGPFRSVMAYQAHRPDPDFYEHFYRPDALSATHRQ
jgi:hypothetical protein